MMTIGTTMMMTGTTMTMTGTMMTMTGMMTMKMMMTDLHQAVLLRQDLHRLPARAVLIPWRTGMVTPTPLRRRNGVIWWVFIRIPRILLPWRRIIPYRNCCFCFRDVETDSSVLWQWLTHDPIAFAVMGYFWSKWEVVLMLLSLRMKRASKPSFFSMSSEAFS